MEIAIINVDKFFWKQKIEEEKIEEKKSIFTIKPDIRYPAKLLAGYPVSGKIISRISGQISIRYNPSTFIPSG